MPPGEPGVPGAPPPPDDRYLRVLLDHAQDGMAVIDARGRIVATTPAVERMLGCEPGTLLGIDGIALVHPDDAEHARLRLAEYLAGNTDGPDLRVRLLRADLTWAPVELAARDANPLIHDAGGVVLSVRNLARRAAVEEALHDTRVLGEAAARVAASMVDVAEGQSDEPLRRALETLADAAVIDRAVLFLPTDDGRSMHPTHASMRTTGAQAAPLLPLDTAAATAWMSALRRGHTIHLRSVAALDHDWETERDHLTLQGVRSTIAAPILVAGELRGYLRFDSLQDERAWDDDMVRVLRTTAGVLSTVFARFDARRAASESEQGLHAEEERLRTLIANIPGVVYRRTPELPGSFELVSPAIEKLTGYPVDDYLARRLAYADLVVGEHRARVAHEYERAADARRPFEIEYPIRDRGGTTHWVLEHGQTLFDETGARRFTDGAIFDVTERKQLEQRLQHEAAHDPLTGLPNRNRLLEHLNHELARSARTPLRVAVLFLDVDRFKNLNDAMGHAGGDELLVAFAKRLSGVLRRGDLASRTGGDEFVVVCTDLHHPVEAEHVADRIQRTLATPFDIHDRQIFVTVSIGIAVAGDSSTAADLLRDADLAAYRAKDRGRNRYEVFDEKLRAATAAALETETDLHRALEGAQLLLLYQPILDLRTLETVGFEALLRWQHPTRGLLTPEHFLSEAEASGLIVPIGRRVVALACSTIATIPPERDLMVAINLSPRELSQADLVEHLAWSLAETDIPPGRLCLDVTESALFEDAPTARSALDALHELGVLIAIDDFGSGFSSLRHLRRLPIDILKIDESFMSELGGEAGDTIVGSIISLARGLGIEVIAEGISTLDQWDRLVALGCTRGQGYAFCEPLPLPDALRWHASAHSSGVT
jgi:diguanylate cyclase (GGDEF)-like protein/PAS domain S-box-containing protein